MTQKLERGFLQIPKDVLILTKVNGKPFGFAEKSVYSYLLNWSNNKDEVFPSMKRMCIDLGVGSRTSMIKYVKKLELLQLLDVVRIEGKASRYIVLGLDGKVLTKPKPESLIKGTNQDKLRKKAEDVVKEPLPSYVPEPQQPSFISDADWEDDGFIPF